MGTTTNIDELQSQNKHMSIIHFGKALRTSFSAAMLTLVATHVAAQAPAESEDVMLQGFFWDSQQQTGWTQLMNHVSDIRTSFTAIWLPPSAEAEGGNTVGGNNVGYHPRTWNNQNSCWGTADNLRTLINTFHANGVRVLADIVVNHRAGYTAWGNFAPDDFGTYGSYQLTAAHICRDDEINTDASAGSERGSATGATDTGDSWGEARDLDHTSDYVRADIKAYLAWLRGEFGYDGWRYDLVKGYSAKYVGEYNNASTPYISVGEYWEGSFDPVAAWIDGTGDSPASKSMAFDFPMKYNAINAGIGKGKFSEMAWRDMTGLDGTTDEIWRPAGLAHHPGYRRHAVTFIDNHDTYRDSNKYTATNIGQAYAFLLSAPGIPCVFWLHWRNADGSTATYHDEIAQMIAARRAAGIHSESDVRVTERSSYYECRATGHNGTLICRIGRNAPTDVPDGFHLACRAANGGWAYYLSDNLDSINDTPLDNVRTADDDKFYSIDGRMTIHPNQGFYIIRRGQSTRKLIIR